MKNILFILFSFLTFHQFYAQQDLDSLLDNEMTNTPEIAYATFKGTRIINGHSIETRKEGILEFMISHRFGNVNTGLYELFGLDQSNIRFGLEYAASDDLTFAIGRSSFEKTYDSYVKYRLFHQQKGDRNFPVGITLFGSATYRTLKDFEPEKEPSFSEKITYTSQILIARKFSPSFSLQIMPTYIHFNYVPTKSDQNNLFALGVGTRVKVSNRISINAEYYYNFNPFESLDTYNSIALGIDIETGGHVFQIMITNSRPMIEKGFIAETTGNFFDGDIRMGFNISRAFQLKNKKIPNK